MVKYKYDAWGNCKVLNATGTEITDATHIGILNPFRYRSYYYDTETGFYFLKTRYYDPELGRFLTIDDPSYLDPETVNGLNLYAYCANNPVMNIDPAGTAWYDVLAWIGIGLIAVSAIVLTAGMAGAVIGGIAGGIIYGAAIGTIAAGVTGAAVGAISGIIFDAVRGNSFGTSIWAGTKAGFGIGTIIGAVVGGAIGGIASASVTGLTNASFWTALGPAGETIAGSAANSQGLVTLGQTFGGKCASLMTKLFGYGNTKFLWASLSKTMASTVAMETVTLFYGGTINATSIYMTYEYPELIRRGIEIIQQFIGG